jgi:hypothetical protein
MLHNMNDTPPSPEPTWDQSSTVVIPPVVAGRLIITLPVSGRLGQSLLWAGFWRLGDLHGLGYADFFDRQWVGVYTVAELLNLVGRLNRGEVIVARPNRPAWRRGGLVNIPPQYRDMPLVEFPFSQRLVKALFKAQFQRMGELHGREWQRLYALRGVGPPSVLELMDVISGLEHAPDSPA